MTATFNPGELECAVSVCLYRNLPGLTVAEIAAKTGGHPLSIRAALKRMQSRGQVSKVGKYRAVWTVTL
jgi:DNA-binding IclR family transcriptional regulator